MHSRVRRLKYTVRVYSDRSSIAIIRQSTTYFYFMLSRHVRLIQARIGPQPQNVTPTLSCINQRFATNDAAPESNFQRHEHFRQRTVYSNGHKTYRYDTRELIRKRQNQTNKFRKKNYDIENDNELLELFEAPVGSLSQTQANALIAQLVSSEMFESLPKIKLNSKHQQITSSRLIYQLRDGTEILKRLRDEGLHSPNLKLPLLHLTDSIVFAWTVSGPTLEDIDNLHDIVSSIIRHDAVCKDNSPIVDFADAFAESDRILGKFFRICAISNYPESRAIADQIMSEYESVNLEKTESQRLPPIDIYNTWIAVHVHHSSKEYGAAAAAEDALLHTLSLSVKYRTIFSGPNVETYNRVMQAWSVVPEISGADRAKFVLDMLLDQNLPHMLPSPVSFSTVIRAYSKRGNPETAEQICMAGLEYFIEQSKATRATYDVTHMLNSGASAWGHSRSSEAHERVQALLVHFTERTKDNAMVQLTIDHHILASYLKSLMYNGDIEAAHDYLIQFATDPDSDGILLHVDTFCAVLHGWMLVSDPSSQQQQQQQHEKEGKAIDTKQLDLYTRVEQLYEVFYTLHQRDKKLHSPTEFLYVSCIKLLRRDGSPEAAAYAERLLNHAHERKIYPWYSYHDVIMMYCESGSAETAWLALDLYHVLEQRMAVQKQSWPNEYSFIATAIVVALSSIKGDGMKSLDASIEFISHCYRTKQPVTIRGYVSALYNLARKSKYKSTHEITLALFQQMIDIDKSAVHSDIQLDKVSCFAALCAVGMNGGRESAIVALAIMQKYIELYQAGRKDLRPTNESLDRLKRIVALSNCNECKKTCHMMISTL